MCVLKVAKHIARTRDNFIKYIFTKNFINFSENFHALNRMFIIKKTGSYMTDPLNPHPSTCGF